MIRVLYVEDEPSQRELVDQLLKMAHIDVALATNGPEGLEKAKSWRPDVILMDLRMPEVSGFDTIEMLQSDPETAHTPIVILSAWRSERHDLRAQELEIKWYITKPFDLDELVATIQQAYGESTG
ncbi:MAG: response regulator [Chloroflexi bacterium]|jgi:CheY-like chemotaxis protein|nr:response regulator [Chloroflexota bacterium]